MHRLAAAHVHDGEAYARVREAVERVQQAARAQRAAGWHGEGGVVAAFLAFDANLPGEPPSDGMEEEQYFDDALDHV